MLAPQWVVTLAGTEVPVDSVTGGSAMGTEEASPFMGGAGQVGGTVSIDWSSEHVARAAGLPHPWRPSFAALPALPVTVDVIFPDDPAPGPWRVFTGTTRSTRTSARDGNVVTTCSDLPPRLFQDVSVPPLARTMPPSATDGQYRRIGLHTAHHTARALDAAGMAPHQPRLSSCVLLAQHAGSAAATVGTVVDAWHEDYGPISWPYFSVTDDGRPYVIHPYITYATADGDPSAPWLLGIDLAGGWSSDTALDVLVTSNAGGGFGVQLVEDKIRLVSVEAGTPVFRGQWTRTAADERVVVTYTNASSSNLRLRSTANIGAPAVTVPADMLVTAGAQVAVQGVGEVGTVQVARTAASADASAVLTAPPASAVRRRIFVPSGPDYGIGASPQVEPRRAIDLLAEQAGAEGTALWIDETGRVQVADQPVLTDRPVDHVVTDDPTVAGIDLLDLQVTVSGGDMLPTSAVEVAWRRPSVDLRRQPRLLLAAGSRQTLASGDEYAHIFHPDGDEDWLDVDTDAQYAGEDTGGDEAYNRRIGTWVGGVKVHATDGATGGWVQPTDWPLAVTVLDDRSVLVEGTVAALAGDLEVVTSPSTGSAGLWARRAGDPLPEIRGMGRTTWADAQTAPAATGAPAGGGTETHDAGWWVQMPTPLDDLRTALVARLADPPVTITLEVALARVNLGEKVAVQSHALGTLAFEAVVIGRDLSGPATMRLTVRPTTAPTVGAVTYREWQDALAATGVTTYGQVDIHYGTYDEIP